MNVGSTRRRWVLVAVTATLATGPALPAAAHTDVLRSSPTAGSSVEGRADRVTIVFDTPIDPESASLDVIGPRGHSLAAGPLSVAGSTLTQSLASPQPPGTYLVSYLVTAPDGHEVRGELSFAVKDPLAASAVVKAPPDSSRTRTVAAQLSMLGALAALGVVGLRSGTRPRRVRRAQAGARRRP